MEIKFKYRPEVKSIEDLQPGDEFLVGDERWRYTGTEGTELVCNDARGFIGGSLGNVAVNNLIRANVPIERDIPYPEGGAEKWELREGDGGKWVTVACQRWSIHQHKWIQLKPPMLSNTAYETIVYAIPRAKPQDEPAPKEYTVQTGCYPSNKYIVLRECDFKPGDRVTVQRVEK
jgi:hypothetical protein